MSYSMPAAATRERARYASLTRSRPADDPELLEAKRKWRAEMFAGHVAKLVAEAPPLSDEQRARIAGLLRGAGL